MDESTNNNYYLEARCYVSAVLCERGGPRLPPWHTDPSQTVEQWSAVRGFCKHLETLAFILPFLITWAFPEPMELRILCILTHLVLRVILQNKWQVPTFS